MRYETFFENDIPAPLEDYQRLIGQLLYAACCTRPDVAFSVGVLSKFPNNPSEIHFKAALKVLGYLASTSIRD